MQLINATQMILNLFRRIPSIKDSTVLGLTSGLIGTFAMDIIDLTAWRKGKHEMLYGHLAGSMIFTPIRMHRRENFFIGQVMHMLAGSGIGGIITWFMKKTGKDHHLLKGSFIGMLSWLTLYEFGQRQKWFTLKARKSVTFYYAFLMNIVFGATTAQAIVTLADPSVFEANPSSPNETLVNARRNNPEPHESKSMVEMTFPDSDSFLHHTI
ncbi:hypothetical protein [Desulfosporosinus metallidurans]|uniref:Uncharacterized protein n=1 Tax=Desulfosporosinus metallidurans TaxID=1888891 RepID=A0A1Q8QIL0_9FIRM|nr:hypothetical protein [Desulfosporosinus metallidurans]OLN27164.1 hypothetical protein DSOL_4676 [Desulfosporosinus metallidurans]